MASVNFKCAPIADTLANWQAFAQALHNAIISIGLVAASDTGQTDFSSLPTAGTTVYRIYTFGDALNTSYPFYLRIDYWRGSSNQVGIKWQVGTGTDGAGTLSGNIGTACDMNSATLPATSSTQYTCIVSGSPSSLCVGLFMDYSSNSAGSYFGLERAISPSSGNYMGDFVYNFCNVGNTSYNVNQCISKTGTAWSTSPIERRFAACMPYSTSSAIYCGKIITSPTFPLCGQVAMPSTLVQLVKKADIPSDGAKIQSTMYGTERLYSRWANGGSPGGTNSLHNADSYTAICLLCS